MFGSRALPPRWPPQCSCVVIESSFDPGERLQAPGSLWFYLLMIFFGFASLLLCLVSFRFVSVSFLVLQSPILAMLIAAKFITCKTKFFWFFFNELIYQSKSRNHRIITQNIHICIRIFLFVSKISICKTGIRCSKQDQINVSNYSILRVFVHLSFSTTPILTARESANP